MNILVRRLLRCQLASAMESKIYWEDLHYPVTRKIFEHIPLLQAIQLKVTCRDFDYMVNHLLGAAEQLHIFPDSVKIDGDKKFSQCSLVLFPSEKIITVYAPPYRYSPLKEKQTNPLVQYLLTYCRNLQVIYAPYSRVDAKSLIGPHTKKLKYFAFYQVNIARGEKLDPSHFQSLHAFDVQFESAEMTQFRNQLVSMRGYLFIQRFRRDNQYLYTLPVTTMSLTLNYCNSITMTMTKPLQESLRVLQVKYAMIDDPICETVPTFPNLLLLNVKLLNSIYWEADTYIHAMSDTFDCQVLDIDARMSFDCAEVFTRVLAQNQNLRKVHIRTYFEGSILPFHLPIGPRLQDLHVTTEVPVVIETSETRRLRFIDIDVPFLTPCKFNFLKVVSLRLALLKEARIDFLKALCKVETLKRLVLKFKVDYPKITLKDVKMMKNRKIPLHLLHKLVFEPVGLQTKDGFVKRLRLQFVFHYKNTDSLRIPRGLTFLGSKKFLIKTTNLLSGNFELEVTTEWQACLCISEYLKTVVKRIKVPPRTRVERASHE